MKKVYNLLLVAIILMTGGCSDFFISDVDSDKLPDQKSKLVVYGYITGGFLDYISVSYSVPYYSIDTSQNRSVINASVVVTYLNNDYVFTYNPETNRYLYSNTQPLFFNPGDTVFLRVEADGYETVTSQTIVPVKQPTLLDKMKCDTIIQNQYGQEHTYVYYYTYFIDVGDEVNFYAPALFPSVVSDSIPIDVIFYRPDEDLYSDVNRDGDTLVVKFSQEIYSNPSENTVDSLFFVLTSFNYEAGKFQQTSYNQNENGNGNPFVEPVIIYSNIKNGLGVFGTATNYAIKLRIK